MSEKISRLKVDDDKFKNSGILDRFRLGSVTRIRF